MNGAPEGTLRTISPYQRLGRFELLHSLGEGGFGVVYAARDTATDQLVALKILTRATPAALGRFKREFRAVQGIHHPNLVRLEGLIEEQGQWLIVMELVEGTDLLSYVRTSENDPSFVEGRVREAFTQLVLGLGALHAEGIIHRDLKPSNVRVTAQGRVVLLDFGLVTSLDPLGQTTQAVGAGTASYMAPEQASQGRLSPAADFYALGVCLYEALTGALPIEADNVMQIMMAKQTARPLAPSSRAPSVPRDLDALCLQLLEPDPALRPSASDVLRALSVWPRRAQARASSAPVPDALPFAGRGAELSSLSAAFEATRSGQQQLVLVEGESGIGKSALVDEFLERVQQAAPDVLVLRSRCYENEQLAYKAFDGAVDGLCDTLGRLSEKECDALLPAQAGLLARIFPVLSSIRSFSKAPVKEPRADLGSQRSEAFHVFVRLLEKLCEQRPVILSIDDLQWADAESFRLLRSLIEDAFPPAVMVLATVRPKDELEAEDPHGLSVVRGFSSTQVIRLSGLPPAAAHQLARELLGQHVPESWLAAIASESKGHPLFLTVLARFAESQDPRRTAELTLDAALEQRLGNLSRRARELLEILALACTPQNLKFCMRAAHLTEEETARLTNELCSKKLLRRRRAAELACFHDRIRRAVVERLPLAQRRELHARIARVLKERGVADPGEVARHHDAAGEAKLAFDAYVQAAELAGHALAFVRAATLQQRAIALALELGLSDAELAALRSVRAHMLSRAGHSRDAAQEYFEAAACAHGEERVALRIRAAQHQLQSAQVELGMATAREALAEVGASLPKSSAGAKAKLVWDRACLGMTGLDAHAVEAVAAPQRVRLDAVWGLMAPIQWLDPLLAASLATSHLRRVLRLGEPRHIAQSLAEEAYARAVQRPFDPRVDALLAEAQKHNQLALDPAVDMHLAYREGVVATMRWNLHHAKERLEYAERVGLGRCPDEPWLLASVRMGLSLLWANLGEYARLVAETSAWTSEAREREDLFALAAIYGLGYGFFEALLADAPDAGKATLARVLEPWPRHTFSWLHFGEMLAAIQTELYRGGEHALQWYRERELSLCSAPLLQAAPSRVVRLGYRTMAGIAAWNSLSGRAAEQMRDETRACLQALHKLKPVSRLGSLNASLLDAQIAALDGRRAEALLMARSARVESETHHYGAACHAALYLEGLLEGGEAGNHKLHAALAALARQGFKNPRRALAMRCPAIDWLEGKT